MCARTWMKLFCIGCDSDKVCHSLDNIPISLWLITLILNINCPPLCFSDDDTFLPTLPVNNSSQSSIEVPSIHWNIHCSYFPSFLLSFPHVYVPLYFLSTLMPLVFPHSFCVLFFAFCLSFFSSSSFVSFLFIPFLVSFFFFLPSSVKSTLINIRCSVNRFFYIIYFYFT